MPDGWEVQHGFDPTNGEDGSEDEDGDGLPNAQEYQFNTDPYNPDTDGDGLSDGAEVIKGLNPLSSDTDDDGLSDNIDIVPAIPFVDYGIFGFIILSIFGSVSFVRATRLQGRVRRWLEENLDDRYFKVEEVARSARVPVKYVLRAPIGIVSSDGKYIYSEGFIRNLLAKTLVEKGVDPEKAADKLKVSRNLIVELLKKLNAVKSTKSGWYYSQERFYGLSSIIVKTLGDGFLTIDELAQRVGAHPLDVIDSLPEDYLISPDKKLPLERKIVYSPKAMDTLRNSFSAILEKNKVLSLEDVAKTLNIHVSDVPLFVPDNAVKSLDGNKYYSESYIREIEEKLIATLARTLEAPIDSLAKELDIPTDDIKTAVLSSKRLIVSSDMTKIYHEDVIFEKLSEISRQYADVPVDDVAKMVGVSKTDLLRLVEKWIVEDMVPIRISYDRSRLAFIGELKKLLELPEPKGLKFE